MVYTYSLTRLSKAEMSNPSTVPTGALRLYKSSKLTTQNVGKTVHTEIDVQTESGDN